MMATGSSMCSDSTEPPIPCRISINRRLRAGRQRAPRARCHTGSESVLETAEDGTQVAHASCTSRLSALGLFAPVISADFRRRITAGSASFLLFVQRTFSTPAAQAVGFGVAAAEALSSLRHLEVYLMLQNQKMS
jgi:hypothetical protein